MEKNPGVILAPISLVAAGVIINIASVTPEQEVTERLEAVQPAAFVSRRVTYEDNDDQPYDPFGFDPTQPNKPMNRAQRRAMQFGHTIRTHSTRIDQV